MTCNRCGQNRSRYTVLSPPCLGSRPARLCPDCMTQGIQNGSIIWVGNDAVGVCEDHASEVA